MSSNSESLKKDSCCCGATKAHPCLCMIQGNMKCAAKSPMCPCYKEIAMGIKVEMEHTKSKEKAEKIAKEHLAEHPDYYSRLKSAGLSAENDGCPTCNAPRKEYTEYKKCGDCGVVVCTPNGCGLIAQDSSWNNNWDWLCSSCYDKDMKLGARSHRHEYYDAESDDYLEGVEKGIPMGYCEGCSHAYPLDAMNEDGMCEECEGVLIVDIDWETDGEDPEEMGLPSSVTVPSDLEEDEIADYLSDEYGFLVNGFVVMGAENFEAEKSVHQLIERYDGYSDTYVYESINEVKEALYEDFYGWEYLMEKGDEPEPYSGYAYIYDLEEQNAGKWITQYGKKYYIPTIAEKMKANKDLFFKKTQNMTIDEIIGYVGLKKYRTKGNNGGWLHYKKSTLDLDKDFMVDGKEGGIKQGHKKYGAETFEASQRKCSNCEQTGHNDRTCPKKLVPFSKSAYWNEKTYDGKDASGFPLVDGSFVAMISKIVDGEVLKEPNSRANMPRITWKEEPITMTWGELDEKCKTQNLVSIGESTYSGYYLRGALAYLPKNTVLTLYTGYHYPLKAEFEYGGEEWIFFLAPRVENNFAENFEAAVVSRFVPKTPVKKAMLNKAMMDKAEIEEAILDLETRVRLGLISEDGIMRKLHHRFGSEEEEFVSCPHCEGSGSIADPSTYLPATRDDPAEVDSMECPYCEGSGEVPEDEADEIPAYDWDDYRPNPDDRWDNYDRYEDRYDAESFESENIIEDGWLAVGKDSMNGEWFCNNCGESYGMDMKGKMLAYECFKNDCKGDDTLSPQNVRYIQLHNFANDFLRSFPVFEGEKQPEVERTYRPARRRGEPYFSIATGYHRKLDTDGPIGNAYDGFYYELNKESLNRLNQFVDDYNRTNDTRIKFDVNYSEKGHRRGVDVNFTIPSESFESDSWLTEGKCAICNSPSKFTVSTAVGERSFCCEACYADYMGLPVKEEGYYGLMAENDSKAFMVAGIAVLSALSFAIYKRWKS